MTVQISIKDIRKSKEFLSHVNSFNLEDIQFLDEFGQPIEIDPETLEEWKFIGLNNTDFVMMEMFKDHS